MIRSAEAELGERNRALAGRSRCVRSFDQIALGRAIVRKPKVFLFDEPLSNLDAKMRVSTRTEISKLHARLGATMIYVTHDQVEAMTMGDRICVMKDGEIQQVAAPLELYNHPANLFVAGFIGSPPMNFFRGQLIASHGRLNFREDNATATPLELAMPDSVAARARDFAGRAIILGIRPENVRETAAPAPPEAARTAEVEVEVAEPMGAETLLYLSTGATSFIARVGPADRFRSKQKIQVTFDLERAHLFEPGTERVLGTS